MSNDPLTTLSSYGRRIDPLAEKLFTKSTLPMYGMLRYFMGFTDEHFTPIQPIAGKRFRPGLLLFLADAYNVADEALGSALSVELFHNFTLIHDDIEDHDELRRGRPTVWKVWGVEEAINTGDAQFVLCMLALKEGNTLPFPLLSNIEQFLLERYLEVFEGQHLDFALALKPLTDEAVTEASYLTMIEKKTAVLVGAGTKAAGLCAGRPADETDALYTFGRTFGLAYQMFDDYRSIWLDAETTGKAHAGDLRERKKTLPVLRARDTLTGEDKTRFLELYAREETTDSDIEELLRLLEKTDAKSYTRSHIDALLAEAEGALSTLSISDEAKRELNDIVRALVPNV